MNDLHSQHLQAFYADETSMPSLKPTLDPGTAQAIHDGVGRQLRHFYADLVAQPLPDRFADVLDRLDRATAGDAK